MSDQPDNSTIFSGIQPSGTAHIGNYLGAIQQWINLQDNNNGFYCIVDHHAITVPYNTDEFPDRVLNVLALYLAAGLDPEKSVIFIQSQVPAHTELAWLLATQTPFGEMSRMTQFKDKAKKQKEQTTLGLFAYPVLMAADILLYQTDLVPVGEDQTQHVELTRDMAKRFNNKFGETFKIPRPLVNKNSGRVMSLTDPNKKMSKSDHENSYVSLTDPPEVIRKKIMGAVTETEPVFAFEKSGPAVLNLLKIYQGFSNDTPATIEKRFAGRGYKEFKESLADLLIEKLSPLQKKYADLRQNDDELRIIAARGKHKAETVANQTLHAVKEKMGLI